MMNAAVRSVPRPVRPATAYPVTSVAAHVPIRMDCSGLACRRRVSITASVPASSVADDDGMSAVQYRARAKYAIQAALLRPVSAAHDQETPAASWVARSLRIWGRNCGTANAAAAIGA